MKKSSLSDANETQARQYLALPHTPFSKLIVCVCVCNNENQESGWSQDIRPGGLKCKIVMVIIIIIITYSISDLCTVNHHQ